MAERQRCWTGQQGTTLATVTPFLSTRVSRFPYWIHVLIGNIDKLLQYAKFHPSHIHLRSTWKGWNQSQVCLTLNIKLLLRYFLTHFFL